MRKEVVWGKFEPLSRELLQDRGTTEKLARTAVLRAQISVLFNDAVSC
jgi:hypothetical protein